MFRILTSISGGQTGSRSAVVKENGHEVWFETKVAAESYADELRSARMPYCRFHQTWTVVAVPSIITKNDSVSLKESNNG